jgi:hypothetical protein
MLKTARKSDDEEHLKKYIYESRKDQINSYRSMLNRYGPYGPGSGEERTELRLVLSYLKHPFQMVIFFIISDFEMVLLSEFIWTV